MESVLRRITSLILCLLISFCLFVCFKRNAFGVIKLSLKLKNIDGLSIDVMTNSIC